MYVVVEHVQWANDSEMESGIRSRLISVLDTEEEVTSYLESLVDHDHAHPISGDNDFDDHGVYGKYAAGVYYDDDVQDTVLESAVIVAYFVRKFNQPYMVDYREKDY